MSIHIDHIKRLGLWAFAAAATALAGCTGDADIEDPLVGRPSEYLSFTATLASGDSSAVSRGTSKHLETEIAQWALQTAPASRKETRGSLTTALNGNNAGVMGFTYDDETDKTALATDNNNIEFVFNGNTLAAAGTPIRWNTINKGKMDIFVCAPYAVAVDGLTVNDAYEPTLDYTVPQDIADHKDIIVSKLQGAGVAEHKNKAIPLTFDHALTAVRFKVGFECTVKSVKLEGVYNKGTYNFSDGKWTPDITSTDSYTVDFGTEGKSFAKNAMLTDGENTMILLPQTLPNDAENDAENDAKITLTCTDKVYTAPIKGTWEAGKLITYTLYDREPAEPIYFDLAAGDVIIDGNNSTYSGKVFKDTDNNGTIETVDVKGTHTDGNRYYVYQSTETNRGNIWKDGTFTRPTYGEIEVKGRPWREFITNNQNVESVIDNWSKGKDALAQNADREGTPYRIDISGKVTCELTIDNIYSTYQQASTSRTMAGISFVPERSSTGAKGVEDKGAENKGAKVTIKMLGDNRVGAVHYANNSANGNEIIFEGPGSLTVADVDGNTEKGADGDNVIIGIEAGKTGYYSNHWCSAIGGNDGGAGGEESAYGIVINSGTIFAGTTKAENCTAIGGGGNSYGQVTINGGTVTAVATTTGTAIGGGIGFRSSGGKGNVTITGGNVYAYNLENRWRIPSSAIGGAGSSVEIGNTGIVTITGGYVYAFSALGTAIGGGSSSSKKGGDARIEITGGEVIAKTGTSESASIGGGTACSSGESPTNTTEGPFSGGSAVITISGNPIIRTGSIGGGGTGDTNGKIGNATIEVSGGDTQAQFILAAGTGEGVKPSFTMTGGKIQGVGTGDGTDGGYLYVKKDGGAVYLENGEVKIIDGTIENCRAEHGGAIYVTGTAGTSTFTMTGGTIQNNVSNSDGGAVYMQGGTVTISGGTIENCRAEHGGAIYVTGTENSIFDMTGGTIQNNVSNSDGGAVYMQGGKVTISGGTIDHNLAVGGNGGGICISGGSLEMSGTASILNNSAEAKSSDKGFGTGNGGGVYISSAQSPVSVKLLSGTISNNTAGRKGGGVCVYMDSETLNAGVSVGVTGGGDNNPTISNNHALMQGGGLYAEGKNAHITIDSGTILNNTVSQYVYNSDVANEYGDVTLNGGKVTHVQVKFFANDGKSSNTEPQHIQKIVTSTNSTLVAPTSFSRPGYKIVGWNTKPSGKGETYTDGQRMNINTDISLYAVWKVN